MEENYVHKSGFFSLRFSTYDLRFPEERPFAKCHHQRQDDEVNVQDKSINTELSKSSHPPFQSSDGFVMSPFAPSLSLAAVVVVLLAIFGQAAQGNSFP